LLVLSDGVFENRVGALRGEPIETLEAVLWPLGNDYKKGREELGK